MIPRRQASRIDTLRYARSQGEGERERMNGKENGWKEVGMEGSWDGKGRRE